MIPKINFSTIDLYLFDGVPYHFVMGDDHSAYFRREDGSKAIERFGWEELDHIVGSDRWECKRRQATIQDAQIARDPYVFIWELTKKQRKLLLFRWFFVCAVNKLREEQSLSLTPEDVAEKYLLIHREATKEWRAFCGEFGKQYYSSKDTSLGATPGASTILKWRRKVDKAGGRLYVLQDQRGRSSNIDIDQESYKFIIQHLREYLLEQQHSGNEIAEKTIAALKIENLRRKELGEPLLEGRCRSALHEWIANFGDLEIDFGRKGSEFAERKYSAAGKAERATRPGQTFQVDEWEVDARNIIMSGPMREGLDQATIDALPRGRRWMYIVIDVATRYIVGFGLSSSQQSAAAIRALHSATRDKTELAQAAGAECDWQGFYFESLESDTGSAFKAEATQRAVRESGATYVYGEAGQPEFRAIIERLFRTFALRAMPYIPGRTFSNPLERGNYDTEGLAVLTDDQLALIFIRFIVDVYHQSPHGGLLKETPANALFRLSGQEGLPEKRSPRTRRRAFGIRAERTVTPSGIRFLGIDFNSKELQKVRQERGSKERAFYIDPENVGTISVWNNDHWIEADCSIENFHNLRLVDWIEVGKILRSRYSAQAELKTSIIFAALNDMRSRATDALKIMGVLPQMFTSADLDRLDRELYWGLSVLDDKPTDIAGLQRAEGGLGYVIGSTSGDLGQGEHPASQHPSSATLPSPDELPSLGQSSHEEAGHSGVVQDKADTNAALDDAGEDEDGWWHGDDDN
ncbi:MAG: DDE-type integrase/transposase/recombinase [Roseovarius sp.]|nr:DDE-type integrase/transposase/recombinase [Roseovarius sp.]